MSTRLAPPGRRQARSIIDALQEQSQSWRGPAGSVAVAAGDETRDVVDGPAVAANLDQRAHQRPHHVAEESFTGDLEGQRPLARARRPAGPGDATNSCV